MKNLKQQSSQHVFMILCGLFLVVAGILLSEPIIASLTEDGEIGSRLVRLGLWAVSILLVVCGGGLIVGRRSPLAFRLALMGFMTLLFFLLLDYLLFLATPVLSENLVRLMSPQAQLRYFQAHETEIRWVYEENIRYLRPGAELSGVLGDEYGYRNPAGYLSDRPDLNLLLVGDSFVWGTAELTLADHLREAWPEASVYSAGIFGNSISQWRYQYADVVARTGRTPELVVFNFYAGNDLEDTELFRRVQGFGAAPPAITYFTFYNSPYLVPQQPGGLALPKLPEMLFLTLGLVAGGEQAAAPPTRLETGYTVTEAWPLTHEPATAAFNPTILAELDATVQMVAPHSRIVISYIPTVTGIYGDLLTDCSWCDADIDQQAANSALLAAQATELGIGYVDVTPALQAAALDTPLWAADGHFSAAGYALYATALAEALATLP